MLLDRHHERAVPAVIAHIEQRSGLHELVDHFLVVRVNRGKKRRLAELVGLR